MAQHKAPTAVVIARTDEGSAFSRWVERYWKAGSIVLLAGAAVVLFVEHKRDQRNVVRGHTWNRVLAVATSDEAGLPRGDPRELEAVAAEIKGSDAAPWALYLAVTSALTRREFAQAESALSALRTEYADHPLVTTAYPFDASGPPQTIPDRLQQILERQRTWEAEHPTLFDNPPTAADAPRVKLQTDVGPIVLALYPDKAPKHVENFLKLCGEGFYNGLAFHRVVPNFMVQTGDPNSREGDVSTWGQGGPDYKIEREENELRHFAGYLSAAKTEGETESSGSQFFITTVPAHHLDGKHVVFGKMIEGMSVAETIGNGATVEGTQRPVNPVRITAVEIL